MTRALAIALLALGLGAPCSAATYQFSTFYGQSYFDQIYAMAADSTGNLYVTGSRWTGPNGPSTSFVSKIDQSGSKVLYDVTLSVGSFDHGEAIAVDSDGNVFVAGTVGASGILSTSNALQPNRPGNGDVFVAKIDPAGNVLFATYFGGSGTDDIHALAVDRGGNVVFVGTTTSTNLPTENPFQPVRGSGQAGNEDGFVAKLSGDGQTLIFSTYFGGGPGTFDGSGNDAVNGVAIDLANAIYVTGSTGSPTFPLKKPLRSTPAGTEAFVARFTPAGALEFSTFLGGSGSDAGVDLAIDKTGDLIVTGTTDSVDFPFTSRPARGIDIFLTRMASDGSALLSSLLVGGSGQDRPARLVVDAVGNLFISGGTDSADFPLRNALQTSLRGSFDAFLIEITGPTIAYSSYLGGTGTFLEQATAVISRRSDEATVAGFTSATDFPVVNAMQPVIRGGQDGFITSVVTGSTSDVSISKNAGSSSVYKGIAFSYTIIATNRGPSTATVVEVHDVLPAGLEFVSASTTRGSCTSTSSILCTIGTLKRGESATINVFVKPKNLGSLTNTASVLHAEPDPDLTNDSSSAMVDVIKAPPIPTLSTGLLLLLAGFLALATISRLS